MIPNITDKLSYNSLRVFQVAAKLENFSAAARELKITQAAVSRRIIGLEEALGFELFAQMKKRVILTTRGQLLLKRVNASFEFLAAGIKQLTEAEPVETILVSAPSSITYFWLEPRLPEFIHQHPTCAVRLQGTEELYYTAASDDGIAVMALDTPNPHWNLTRLFGEELTPVAAPAYLESIGRPPLAQDIPAEEIAALDLIGYARLNTLWYTFEDWFSERGIAARTLRFPVVHSTYQTAINAALRGDGVVLGSRHLLRSHIASGALVEISSQVKVTSLAYYVGTPKSGRIAPAAQQLADWLIANA
jgi:DNA-binding transcriptional LysR family regulator